MLLGRLHRHRRPHDMLISGCRRSPRVENSRQVCLLPYSLIFLHDCVEASPLAVPDDVLQLIQATLATRARDALAAVRVEVCMRAYMHACMYCKYGCVACYYSLLF